MKEVSWTSSSSWAVSALVNQTVVKVQVTSHTCSSDVSLIINPYEPRSSAGREMLGVGSPHFKRWGLGGHCWEQPLACYCELPSGSDYCGSPPPVSCLSPGHSMPASVVTASAKKPPKKSTHIDSVSWCCLRWTSVPPPFHTSTQLLLSFSLWRHSCLCEDMLSWSSKPPK